MTAVVQAGADSDGADRDGAESDGTASGERVLVEQLQAGDEAVFNDLVQRWSPPMLRLARAFVHTRQSAEDVVQETWLAVITGLTRFEGRSSLRTWVYAILVNKARTAGVKDARSIPWSQLGDDTHGPTVDPARFQGADGEYPGHWTSIGAPARWAGDPERRALDRELRALVDAALDRLPVRQRVAVTVRDLIGLDADEACEVLGVSQQNQRVLLHRGRAGLRAALETYAS